MHYPPYLHSPEERGNYDNIDEPARSWLLRQMARPAVEAAFAGHVHSFWYDRVGRADLYMLPSTAFLRHDFTELYRVAPEREFGRGDADKLGYFIVDVFADGHVAYPVRTHGMQAGPGEMAIRPAARRAAWQGIQLGTQQGTPQATQLATQVATEEVTEEATQVATQPARRLLANPQSSSFDGVGVELRHPWTESMQIAATGGVQEFGRKRVRNDYPTLALWEMGVRLAKVPCIDLADHECRARMTLMARKGQRYLVTSLGAPRGGPLRNDLHACGVTGFEVNATLASFDKLRSTLADLRRSTEMEIWFARILAHDHGQYDGHTFSHHVKSGFAADDLTRYRHLLADAHVAGHIDGVTLRVLPDESLRVAALRAAGFTNETGCAVLLSLKLAGDSLALARADDRANVARVAEVMILSKAFPRLRFIFDTFMDVDRGYFPRHAFIDRRYTPRAPAHAFTALAALFSDAAIRLYPHAPGSALAFDANGIAHRLVCGPVPLALEALAALPAQAMVFDLCDAGHAVEEMLSRTRERLAAVPSDMVRQEALLVRL